MFRLRCAVLAVLLAVTLAEAGTAPARSAPNSPLARGWRAYPTPGGTQALSILSAGNVLIGERFAPSRSDPRGFAVQLWRSTNGTTWKPVSTPQSRARRDRPVLRITRLRPGTG